MRLSSVTAGFYTLATRAQATLARLSGTQICEENNNVTLVEAGQSTHIHFRSSAPRLDGG